LLPIAAQSPPEGLVTLKGTVEDELQNARRPEHGDDSRIPIERRSTGRPYADSRHADCATLSSRVSADQDDVVDAEEVLRRRAPRVAAILDARRSVRERQIRSYAPGARVVGVDQLLGYLDTADNRFASGPPLMANTARLIARARADFVIALDATVGGLPSVASDAMRDVLEIEMLLLDFAVDPDRLDGWLSDARRAEFMPSAVRKRLKAAGAGEVTSSVFGADYAAHSSALHVNPTPLPFGGKAAVDDGFELDAGFWEMLEHGRRLLTAIEAVRVRATEDADAEPLGPLDAFWDAHQRVMEMQEMVIGLMMLPSLQAELGRPPSSDELLEHVRKKLAKRRH
jgi:hypothetical protein